MRVSSFVCLMTGLFLASAAPSYTCAQAPAASPSSSQSGLPLVAVAGSFRSWLAISPQTLMAKIDPASRATLEALLAPDEVPEFDRLWPVLMAGAVQVRKETDVRGETLWYNPAFDCGLAVKWEKRDGTWQAIQAAFVLGETIRGTDMGGALALPAGRYATGDVVQQHMDDGGYVTLARAREITWHDLYSGGQETTITAIARLRSVEQSLRQMRTSTGYDTAQNDILSLLVREDLVRLGASTQLRLALDQLGDRARLSLRPSAAYYRSEVNAAGLAPGWTMVLQTPDAPTVTLLAHFVDPDALTQRQAVPTQISIIDFNSSEGQP